MERVVAQVAGSAGAARRVLVDIDLDEVDPASWPELRARLAGAVAVFDRLLRVVESRAAEAEKRLI
jgi:hypothetical protein